MSTPVQSLTSLDWYRQALDESANGRRSPWIRWFRGLSFLLFHVSLYAISIVLLFAIDLIRSPGSLWIDKVALAWAVLIVVHAAIVGLIWAIGLLKEDESSETHELRWSSASTSGGWGAKREEPQDADFRMSVPIPDVTVARTTTSPARSAPLTTAATATPPPTWSSIKPPASPSAPVSESAPPSAAGHESPWSGWEPASAATIARRALEGTGSGERASWTEASAAAWLTHASGTSAPNSANPSTTTSDPDTFKQQFRNRLERRNADRGRIPKPSDGEDSGIPPQ